VDSSRALQVVTSQLHEALGVHEALAASDLISEQLVTWGQTCANALREGGIVFFAGNGGSFADAQHLAAELTGKMGRVRSPLAGIALGTNSSSMSAIGNDFSYELTFARELEGLSRSNSVVIALSTSGNSANILELVDQGQRMGIPTLVFTGANGGAVAERCEVVRVPSDRTERIQEMHILLGHTLCLLIEELLGICTVDLPD
jgi:D-sedoheptulose 7-phosphate isomerase